jgi:peptidoglycan/xylan/chitin deacetylase (PgdA/CDA1 family)
VNHAVRAVARARGHRLVLVYHRVGRAVPDGCEVIPSLSLDTFRAQLQALGEVANFVTLADILTGGKRKPSAGTALGRPDIAVTFDDDLPSHATLVLPVLRQFGIPAAFFLSGRALHGLGPYWFQQLETVLAAHGEARTAELLGLTAIQSAADWVRHGEQDAAVRRGVIALAGDLPAPGVLARDELLALGAAGMTIGFHTVEHRLVPAMDDAALSDAVSCGRDELASASGHAVRYFAYPYGQADARSAAALARAGFDAAFTGRPEPLRPRSSRYLVGRWEPGALGVDDLLVKLAVRLHRAAPPSAPSSGRWTSGFAGRN